MSSYKLIIAAVSAIGLVLILIWMQGGFHSKVPGGMTNPSAKEANFKTFKAKTSSSAGDVTVSGSVVSKETARIASRVPGNVIELNVEAGSQVKKGDALLKLEAKELVEREAQAQAALESAQADLVKAENDFARYKALFEKESIAKKEYDEAKAKFEMAQASEQRAKASLDEAKTMLSYTTVTAPFDGIVAERSVNLGDLATVGKQLFTIYAPDTLELVAPVGEQYASFLYVGGEVTVSIPSIGIKEITQIREIVPQRDEKTRTITVKAQLKEAPGLGPGLYGTLTFNTSSREVIVIPSAAVNVVGQLESVRVLESGSARIRHIKTGRKLSDGNVEVLSGLNAGEDVIVE
ncbi:MAG: efflux RND transporter periplasmic adaptor subunit [Desulfomonilaceae bacterium]